MKPIDHATPDEAALYEQWKASIADRRADCRRMERRWHKRMTRARTKSESENNGKAEAG